MILELDHSLFRFINQDHTSRFLDLICPTLRDRNVWIPFYIIGALFTLYKFRWRGLMIITLALVAILLSDQTSNFIKHYTHRLRPCLSDPHVRLLLAHCSDTFSFTSSHAANHFALATYLSLLIRRPLITALLLCWAALISFAQVYVGLHFPADVLGGALLGLICGFLSHQLYTLIHSRYIGASK